MEVKVEIFKNKMILSTGSSSVTVLPKSDFTTTRLLVGNFLESVECLKRGLNEIGVKSFLKFGKPTLHIYPREMVEGGLSTVEERVFREMGVSAGARETKVHA